MPMNRCWNWEAKNVCKLIFFTVGELMLLFHYLPPRHQTRNFVSQHANYKNYFLFNLLFLGAKAKAIINHSRENVARMVGGKAEDIIFTSGGTEVITTVSSLVLLLF